MRSRIQTTQCTEAAFAVAVLSLAVIGCRDEPTPGLGDAAPADAADGSARDAAADAGRDGGFDAAEDGGGLDVRDDAGPGDTDAGPSCLDDGPLELTYVEEAPGGYGANCQPVIPPDPTTLSLDFLRLENPGSGIAGLAFQGARIRRASTGESLQTVELDPFVPFPSRLDRGEVWSSLVTKTSGEEVGAAVCGFCGDAVELELEIEATTVGCFRERVAIGDLGCAF